MYAAGVGGKNSVVDGSDAQVVDRAVPIMKNEEYDWVVAKERNYEVGTRRG